MTSGQPVCSNHNSVTFFKNSETEKVILTQDDYEYVWKWSDVTMPTDICWGMKMGQTFFELRKDGKSIIQTSVKADFIRQYNKLHYT